MVVVEFIGSQIVDLALPGWMTLGLIRTRDFEQELPHMWTFGEDITNASNSIACQNPESTEDNEFT